MKKLFFLFAICLIVFVTHQAFALNADVDRNGKLEWRDGLLSVRSAFFAKPQPFGSYTIKESMDIFLAVSFVDITPFPNSEFIFLLRNGRLKGDFNDNCYVELAEIVICDVYHDRLIDIRDLVLIGQRCGMAVGTGVGLAKYDINGNGIIGEEDVSMASEQMGKTYAVGAPSAQVATTKNAQSTKMSIAGIRLLDKDHDGAISDEEAKSFIDSAFSQNQNRPTTWGKMRN
ncbi:hypothetical protein L6252_01115 [Candidatus Parcubacteria bacterium]|nr:hypothetical protein [Candidatus Parcubacteria bacterium]